MINRWLALLSALLIALLTPSALAQAAPSGEPSPTPSASPSATNPAEITFGTGDIPSGKIGTEIDIKVPLVNRGGVVAKDVLVTPKPAVSPEHFPFEITKTDYSVRLSGDLEPQAEKPTSEVQKLVDLGKFKIRGGLVSGYYAMPLAIQYNAGAGQQIVERVLFIKVDGLAQPGPDAGGAKPLPDVDRNNPPVDLSDLGKHTGDLGGGLPGGAGAGAGSAVMPRVMLTAFHTDPEIVVAGQEFTLDFTLQNMSRSTAVGNMRVSITSAEAAFLPVGGASSVYIDRLSAGQVTGQQLRFKALPTLDEQPHMLAMAIEYDANGAPGTSQEALAISVRQPARIDIANINLLPEQLTVNEEGSLSFTINNRGKVQLYNVSVKLKKDTPYTADDSFIGNVPAGSSATADLIITPTEVTEKPIVVEIVYEDAYGKATTIQKEVKAEVWESIKDHEPAADQNNHKGSVWGTIVVPLLIVLVLVAAIVGLVIWRKRKDRKAAELKQHLGMLDPSQPMPPPTGQTAR